ncbi:hypothetical protein RB195_024585 [Necator americanus]|uniref:Uncharacterized protein n=1 Tax=Necator americanus TaxID=51031 RepID=A0ABR1ENW3_NECAM
MRMMAALLGVSKRRIGVHLHVPGYWKVLSRWVPHALTEPNARGNAVVGATVGQPQARRQSLCAPAPRLDQCTPRKAAEKVDLLQFTS